VLPGWGLSSEKKGNAIANAHTPNMTSLSRDFLHTKLDASGLSVGLPAGVMGNSEVGHLTMGAGRVDFQDLVRINQAIEQGDFAKNDTLQLAIRRAKAGNGRVHLLGLVSDGAVHSHIQHLFRFLEALKAGGVPQAYVHVFADGRDTPPTTAVKYIKDLQDFMTQQLGGYGRIASVQGRYFAMDRDKRWERVQIAYEALTAAKGDKVEQVAEDKLLELVQKRYDAGEKDEFLRPIIVQQSGSVAPLDGLIADADTLIFINFRSDRMREITSIFAKMTEEIPSAADASLPFPQEVPRRKNLMVVGMTKYDEKVVLPTLFPPQTMTNVLPEWISRHNLSQFHTAETEKYAHVTFFFAGGQEASFPLEERALIPSPSVATYDLAPEMSQEAVGASVVQAIESGRFPFIMTNLAAPDMVGHTGHYDKAVIACTKCDEVIGTIWEACKKNKSVWRSAHAESVFETPFETGSMIGTPELTACLLCVACLLYFVCRFVFLFQLHPRRDGRPRQRRGDVRRGRRESEDLSHDEPDPFDRRGARVGLGAAAQMEARSGGHQQRREEEWGRT
jgi:2,3-bisphosphoglycerate-independent phosphoglycerate mutase